MAYVLDTDVITIVQEGSEPSAGRMQARIDHYPRDQIFFTVVSFQEQAKGWLGYLNRAREGVHILRGYDKLIRLLERYGEATVLPYDQPAHVRFRELVKLKVRV